MLHSWPTERPLLNSGCLSPHTALGKGMLASPCVLVQVSLPTVSLSPPLPPVVPGWALHLPRVWCQEPVYSFTSRKTRLLLFSHLEPGVVNTLVSGCGNSLCKTDVERPWRVHSLGQLQLHLPPQEEEQEVNPPWPKAINPNYTRFLLNLGLGIEFAMNYPFNWNPQFYCLHG